MLNVYELERRWLMYRLKRLLPYGVVLLTAFAAALVILFWPDGAIDEGKSESAGVENIAGRASEKPEGSTQASQKASYKPEDTSAVEEVKTGYQPQVPEQNKTMVSEAQLLSEGPNVLKPSFGFIRNIEEEIVSYHNRPQPKKNTSAKKADTKIKTTEPKSSPVKTVRNTHKTNTFKSARTVAPKHSGDRQVLIRHQQDDLDLQDVIKRFKKNKNPALSLFIAKKYYAMGVYEQAYNYALLTNQLDNEVEDSWLIFTKSLVKLGKKEMAVKTLMSYIRKTNSVKAKILLDDISKGTFE